MFVDGEVVASRAIDNDALMRLADYLEQETDDTFLKVYSPAMTLGQRCLLRDEQSRACASRYGVGRQCVAQR